MKTSSAANEVPCHIADALVFAIAYISRATGDDVREDDDCHALESLMHMVSQCSSSEQRTLLGAARRALVEQESADEPDEEVVQSYRDVVENLESQFEV